MIIKQYPACNLNYDDRIPSCHIESFASSKDGANTDTNGDNSIIKRNNNKMKEIYKNKKKIPVVKDDEATIEELENYARETALQNPVLLAFLSNLAAFKVLILYILTVETLCSSVLTIGLTLFWYYQYRDDEKVPSWNGNSLNFILVTFAVVSPLTGAFNMAFARRERALTAIASFRSFSHHLYAAHCLWDWPHDKSGGKNQAAIAMLKKGQTTTIPNDGNVSTDNNAVSDEVLAYNFWLEHCDAVLAQIIAIGDELSRFLTLPASSRGRHRLTRQGRVEAARTIRVGYQLMDSITSQRLTRLVIYTERLKSLGLATNEISRAHQYERFMSDAVEQLRMIKMYRTPQAFRSFARVFTLVLPPFYAPAFAQVAIDIGSIGVGIAFGILTVLALSGLFESLQILEDPFTSYITLDGVNVREEFEVINFSQLISTRALIFPTAPEYPLARRAALRIKKTKTNNIFDTVPSPGGGKDQDGAETLSVSSCTKHHRNTSSIGHVGIPPRQSHHLFPSGQSSPWTGSNTGSDTGPTDTIPHPGLHDSLVVRTQTGDNSQATEIPSGLDNVTGLQGYRSSGLMMNVSDDGCTDNQFLEDLELGTALQLDNDDYRRDTSYSPSNEDDGLSELRFWPNNGRSALKSDYHGALSRRHIRSASAG